MLVSMPIIVVCPIQNHESTCLATYLIFEIKLVSEKPPAPDYTIISNHLGTSSELFPAVGDNKVNQLEISSLCINTNVKSFMRVPI